MSVIQNYQPTYDGYMATSPMDTWFQARLSPDATPFSNVTGGVARAVGSVQQPGRTFPTFRIFRTFLKFEGITPPAGHTLTSANLKIAGFDEPFYNTLDSFKIIKSTVTWESGVLIPEDFPNIDYGTTYGDSANPWDNSGFITNIMPLNSTAIGEIDLNSFINIALVNQYDYNDTPPPLAFEGFFNGVIFNSPPEITLELTYDPPAGYDKTVIGVLASNYTSVNGINKTNITSINGVA